MGTTGHSRLTGLDEIHISHIPVSVALRLPCLGSPRDVQPTLENHAADRQRQTQTDEHPNKTQTDEHPNKTQTDTDRHRQTA